MDSIFQKEKGSVVLVVLVSYVRMLQVHLRAVREEDGQGLTEYALILALIAVIAIVALKVLGTKVSAVLSTIANSL